MTCNTDFYSDRGARRRGRRCADRMACRCGCARGLCRAEHIDSGRRSTHGARPRTTSRSIRCRWLRPGSAAFPSWAFCRSRAASISSSRPKRLLEAVRVVHTGMTTPERTLPRHVGRHARSPRRRRCFSWRRPLSIFRPCWTSRCALGTGMSSPSIWRRSRVNPAPSSARSCSGPLPRRGILPFPRDVCAAVIEGPESAAVASRGGISCAHARRWRRGAAK